MAVATSANAVVVPLTVYNLDAPDLNLSVDVTVDNGLAYFEFSNDSTGDSAGSVVAQIYFESGLADLLSNPSIAGGSGVSFSADDVSPGSPPGGQEIGWAGEFYAIGATPPPSQNGLGVGDSLTVTFDYAGTVDALVAALTDADGNSRIAVHVLDCVGENSCGAVSTIPVPAAFPLLAAALSGLFLVRRRNAS